LKLYHATSKQNKNSILAQGILRKFSTLWKNAGGAIYLAKTPEEAFEFGEVVFEVEIDPKVPCGELSDWEYCYWADIPPNKLRIFNTFSK
jgi:hypothetical protein